MQKQAPSAARIFVMVAFALSCFGLLLFLWLAFGGSVPLKPSGYKVKIPFREATQLANEADVRISGVPVGKVKSVQLQRNGLNVATVELDERYAPLPQDARAILRQKTLLGETYVELTPGTDNGRSVPEGGTLRTAQVSPTVELDEIFRAFDEPTRNALREWLQTQAKGFEGRGQDVSNAFGNLPALTEDADRLLKLLVSQEGAVRQLVRDTGVVFGALSERRGQLRGLIENANVVFATTAAKNRELQETFVILPTFERESRATLARLERFARNADPLVSQLRPAARELSPTLVDLAATAPDLRALFRELGPLITASRAGLPAAEQVLRDLRPVLGRLDPFLRNLIPITDFLGRYRRELTAFFANSTAATQASDRPGASGNPVHYLRTTNPTNPETLALYPRRLGTNRPNPYHQPGNFEKLGRPALPVYESRHCGAGGIPLPLSAVGVNPALISPQVSQLIANAVFNAQGGGETPAPPCIKQGPFDVNGRVTQYPQVTAYPPPR